MHMFGRDKRAFQRPVAACKDPHIGFAGQFTHDARIALGQGQGLVERRADPYRTAVGDRIPAFEDLEGDGR